MKTAHIPRLVLSAALLMGGTLQAEYIHWIGGAGSQDWNEAANWKPSVVPGVTASDIVMFVGSGDNATLETPFSFSTASTISMRDDSVVTLNADLSGVFEFYLGGNANRGGGTVHQTAGTLSVQSLNIGSRSDATSASVYTLSGGRIENFEMISVNKGTLLLRNNCAKVSTGSLEVSSIGTLAFALGVDGVDPIQVKGEFRVMSAAKLTIDASGLTAGAGVYDLVHFDRLMHEFDASNVTITGLAPGLSGSITADAHSMKLTIVSSVSKGVSVG